MPQLCVSVRTSVLASSPPSTQQAPKPGKVQDPNPVKAKMVPSAPIKCLTHKTEFFTIKDALRHIWKLHNMRMLVSHATKVWCCGKSIGYYGTPDYDDEEMFKHLWAEHHPVFYTFSVDLDYLRELKLIGPEDEM